MHITLDTAALHADLDRLAKRQIPQAVVWALNDTAKDVLAHVQKQMEVVFDRPTRFTKNAFQVGPYANKSKPEAIVQERPSVGARHYLKVQEAGGHRPQTGFEARLAEQLAYRGVIRSILPATGDSFNAAKLDGFGNWSKGERNRLLSGLGAQSDAKANETETSRKRAKRTAKYFVPQQGLAPGVYRRDQPGGIPVRILKFSPDPARYGPKLNFMDGATDVYTKRIAPNLSRAIDKAIATAR